jgi:alginate O-acetyltransferase complex protein AlgI
MNFAEIRFWGWLAAGLTVIALLRWALGPRLGSQAGAFDRSALLLLGLFLLSCVSLVTVAIFVVVAVSSYLGLTWLVSHPSHRPSRYLWALISMQLLPLLYYKYANFVLNRVAGFEFSTLRDLIIPVGISFYSFQMVGFVVDTLVFKRPLPRFLDFMNFAAFFPQIVAGPIERRADLLPQMERFRFRWSAEDINEGAAWVVVGLFFKLCLADNVALYFNGRSATNAYLIWLDNVLFGLRIYYDFAGYSLVAIGLGRCLGIRLTLNFLSPYCSTSMVEFWRRWHITLSQWFRDYVYVPLGGGRTSRWAFNVALVFVVSGIWHGAGWNFVIWGAVHGGFLIGNRMFSRRMKLPAPAAWILTLSLAMGAWLCFYETRTPILGQKWMTLFTPSAYGPAAVREALHSKSSADFFVMGCILLLAGVCLGAEWLSVARKDEPYYLLRQPVALVGLIVFIVLLAPGTNNAFIYFAF